MRAAAPRAAATAAAARAAAARAAAAMEDEGEESEEARTARWRRDEAELARAEAQQLEDAGRHPSAGYHPSEDAGTLTLTLTLSLSLSLSLTLTLTLTLTNQAATPPTRMESMERAARAARTARTAITRVAWIMACRRRRRSGWRAPAVAPPPTRTRRWRRRRVPQISSSRAAPGRSQHRPHPHLSSCSGSWPLGLPFHPPRRPSKGTGRPGSSGPLPRPEACVWPLRPSGPRSTQPGPARPISPQPSPACPSLLQLAQLAPPV